MDENEPAMNPAGHMRGDGKKLHFITLQNIIIVLL